MVQVKHDTSLWMHLYTEEQYEKACQVLRESFETQEEQSPDKLIVGYNIGVKYFNQKKYTKARDMLVPTLKIMQRQVHPQTITCLMNLAHTYVKLKDLDQAEKLVEEMRTIQGSKDGRTDHDDLTKLIKVMTQLRKKSQGSSAVRKSRDNTAESNPAPGIERQIKPGADLNPFDAWSAYQSGLCVDEDVIRHARVWVTIFKSAGWLDTAVLAGANPTLVGSGIDKFLDGNINATIYLVLLDWAPLVNRRDTTSIFDFLQEHDYDQELKEVHIRGTNIIVNIQSVIDNYNYTGLEDITKVIPSGTETRALSYSTTCRPFRAVRAAHTNPLMYHIVFPRRIVLSKERHHDIAWLFVEEPDLSKEMRKAKAEFPKLDSMFKKKSELLSNAERNRLSMDLKWKG